MEVYKLLLNKDINSKITMHDQCRLGKWYYGFEGQQFSNYYSFRSLEAPHKGAYRWSLCAELFCRRRYECDVARTRQNGAIQ